MAFHQGFLYLLVSLLMLCLLGLWSLCWPHPVANRGLDAHDTPPAVEAPLSTRLPALSTRLHCLVSGGTCAKASTSLERGQKSSRCSQTHRHAELHLSQPAVPVLRQHRCALSCAGGRGFARSCRTNPDVSVSGLPYYVQRSMRHALVPIENALPKGAP